MFGVFDVGSEVLFCFYVLSVRVKFAILVGITYSVLTHEIINRRITSKSENYRQVCR